VQQFLILHVSAGISHHQKATNRKYKYFTRQTEIHIAERLVLEPSPFEVEIAIAKLKEYKSPGSDQIPAELIQAGGET
jgi:hypothetical protein